MRDEAALLLILWAIYWIELGIWLPHRNVLFAIGRRLSPAFADNFPGNASGSLRWNHCLPWFQSACTAQQPLLALSTEAMSNHALQNWSRLTRSRGKLQCFAYGEIRSVEIDGVSLKINGMFFANCETEEAARRHKQLIATLSNASKPERENYIREYYSSRFPSENQITARIQAIQKETSDYCIFSSLVFVYAFVACPLAYYFYPSPSALLMFLLSSVFMGWGCTFLFHRAHRRLLPEERQRRFQCLLKQILCFPVAVGSCKDLTLHSLTGYDPLPIGKALLTSEQFRALSQKLWLDLKYPIAPVGENSHWTRALDVHREAAAEFLERCGIDLLSLEQPESGWEAATTCYCPRCHTEFHTLREHCSECPGVATIALT